MSLDQNLFTLQFVPHKQYNNVIDLLDSSGNLHYRKQRITSPEYKIEVYDPLSESLLVTATAPSATSKTKILELKNPTQIVELKYTGTISFRWNFKWEEHEFEWKREECFILRKPDPPVLVAVTKEPNGRLRTLTVQILDYNLHRFDINDRKGLEILILTTLMTFSDSNEAHRTPVATPPVSEIISNADPQSSESALKLPPKPPAKTGVDRVAELQAIRNEYNEVTVEDEGSVDDYAQYCSILLNDDAILFITVKSEEAKHVSKVLQVVEQTKRIRHKTGLSEDEELHQYVLYDTKPEKKRPRIINLDDDKDKNKSEIKYEPPSSLTVHMSKIFMPELQPKAHQENNGKKARARSPQQTETKTKLSHPTITVNKACSSQNFSPSLSMAPYNRQPGAMKTQSLPSLHPHATPHLSLWTETALSERNNNQIKSGVVTGLLNRLRL